MESEKCCYCYLQVQINQPSAFSAFANGPWSFRLKKEQMLKSYGSHNDDVLPPKVFFLCLTNYYDNVDHKFEA